MTTGEVATYYFNGDKLVAKRTGATAEYVHQDSLGSTSVVSDAGGALVNSILFCPFGSTRSGDVPTDRKFTGQRLDGTGLYYYGARYYDPTIGRFISADSMVPNPANPQSLNRYSYCLNNPLKYTDPPVTQRSCKCTIPPWHFRACSPQVTNAQTTDLT